MKFAIITHVNHKYQQNDIYAYEPYVREMNLWGKSMDACKIVAPISYDPTSPIDSKYNFNLISLEQIPSFNLLSIKNKFLTLVKLPLIIYKIFKVCFWADHIHIRCPGNIGLLGCFVQIFFPFKKKTVKYAGNWDPKSKQPLSYRIQKWVVSNIFLTHNCKVLVYGKWENQSKNIIPFFTATYKESDIVPIPIKKLNDHIKIIFVGTFSKSKQPILSVKATEELLRKGYKVELNMYGDGSEFLTIKKYIEINNLGKQIILHGNQDKEIIKLAFQKAHFLIFLSKSEGWPKVVAEAMFWSCIPISSKVSCIPNMLENGKRGSIVEPDLDEILKSVISYINDEECYKKTSNLAKLWSQKYTLEVFSEEIEKLIEN
tara:strand:+ start:14293 stop:15411 length:1119 start_codon:yes stop_codon:yes gene_type:complete